MTMKLLPNNYMLASPNILKLLFCPGSHWIPVESKTDKINLQIPVALDRQNFEVVTEIQNFHQDRDTRYLPIQIVFSLPEN